MIRRGVITGVSVAHQQATVDEIEAATAADIRDRLNSLTATAGVSEAFAIQTCNRSEAYVVTDSPKQGKEALSEITDSAGAETVEVMSHEESIRHLMRLAAGLESLVIGEDQIIGQFKDAIETARAEDSIGPILDDALLKAVHVGERARTETAINDGVVSLGSAAVTLASSETELADATALVIGAGEMATIAAESLAETGVSQIVIANRTVPHATHIAETVPVSASGVSLPAAPAVVDDASVVIAATGSPEPVLRKADFEAAGETVCIDLAQPRDIEPTAADHAAVELYDIDALEAITDKTRAQRSAAAEAVEEMIDEEFDRLLALFKRKRADEAISAMYESAERVKQREVGRALAKLDAHEDVSDKQEAVIESLADTLVNQLLSAPTKSLREAAAEDDWTTIQTAMQLFNPEFDQISADEKPESAAEEMPESAAEEMPASTPEEMPESLDEIPDSVVSEMPPHVIEQLSEE